MKTTGGDDVSASKLTLVLFDESRHGQPFEVLRDEETGEEFLRCEGLVVRLLPEGSDFLTRYVECGHVLLSRVAPGERNYCSLCRAWRTTDPHIHPKIESGACVAAGGEGRKSESFAGRLIWRAVVAEGLGSGGFPYLLARRQASEAPGAPDLLSTAERRLLLYTLACRALTGRRLIEC